MLCFVLTLGSISISLSLSLSLFIAFCKIHNIDCDSGIFLGFALFGCCVLLLFITFGICSFVCVTFVYQGSQY